MTIMYILLFAVYVGVIAAITWNSIKSGRKKRGNGAGNEIEEGKEFYVGGRNSSAWDIGCSIVAGMVDPFGLLMTFGLIMMFGFSGAGIYVAFYIMFHLMTLLVPNFYRRIIESDARTMSDVIAYSVGPRNEKLYGLVMVFFGLMSIVAVYGINLTVFEHFLGLGKIASTVIAFGITIAYVVMGGFRTIIKTDVLQYTIFAICFVALCVTLPINIIDMNFGSVSEWFGSNFWMFAPVILVQSLVKPANWQPIIGAKDEATAKCGFFYGALLHMLIILPILFVAFWVKDNYSGVDPMKVLFQIVDEHYAGYKPIIFVAFVAAMMSTIDTYLFYVGTTINRIFKINNYTKTNFSWSEQKTVQIIIIVLSIITLLGSMFVGALMPFALAMIAIAGVMLVPFLGGMVFDLRYHDKLLAVAVMLGIGVFAYQFMFPPTNYLWTILPTGITLAVFLLGADYRKIKKFD